MSVQDLIMSVLVGAIGCIGYFLRDLQSSIKEKMKENHEEIKKTQENLEKMKNQLPHTYVFRDDFLRAISNLDTKVDRLTTDVSHINENVAKLLSGGERG
ncbi:hypothetical protein [Anaerosinus gibii]|uniref:Uncharacterized protein n=1 Tax=Selenobaculum gibii TaxID=3054208 RepID=A0A9Y2ES92_9FIRM|nr:hypothetical protein [Selenobaculum gbiensis]WIW70623.1 hypothetical protein P3F81_12165 [Selenobaculum gbiensis]